MKKKTIIIIAAIVAVLLLLYFLWFRKRFTTKGVVASLSGLSDDERKKINAECETVKQLAKQVESQNTFVKDMQQTYLITRAKAVVYVALSRLEAAGVFSESRSQSIHTELIKP